MIIATFTSGDRTIVGYKNKDEETIFRSVDSRIIYGDPEKLVDNFIALLENLFGIKALSKNDILVFALSGNMDSERQEIIESAIINKIPITKSFDGFSFVKAFGKMVGDENIYLLNDSDSIAMYHADGNTDLPAVSIHIDHSVGVSIIKGGGTIINYGNSLRPLSQLENKKADYLLCDKGIDDILYKGESELLKKYTLNLIDVLKDITKRGIEDGLHFKKCFIHSSRRELVIEELVKANHSGIEFSFNDGSEVQKSLPLENIIGTLRALEILRETHGGNLFAKYKTSKLIKLFGDRIDTLEKYFDNGGTTNKQKLLAAPKNTDVDKVVKIEYFTSDGVKVQTFESFQEFVQHYGDYKPLVDGEDYYDLLYSDDTKMKVYLDSLNLTTDLQKYKF